MATKTISVSIIEGATELTFQDSEGNKGKDISTKVNCEDTVRWEVKSKGLIITGIPMKNEKGKEIWSPGDAPSAGKEGAWEGKICKTAPKGKQGYSVTYTINGGRELEQDPDLNVED